MLESGLWYIVFVGKLKRRKGTTPLFIASEGVDVKPCNVLIQKALA